MYFRGAFLCCDLQTMLEIVRNLDFPSMETFLPGKPFNDRETVPCPFPTKETFLFQECQIDIFNVGTHSINVHLCVCPSVSASATIEFQRRNGCRGLIFFCVQLLVKTSWGAMVFSLVPAGVGAGGLKECFLYIILNPIQHAPPKSVSRSQK